MRRSPLFVLLFTVFVDLIGFGIVIPLLPFYAQSVGGGPALLGLLVAVFFAMQFISSPILGRLSDRFGRRPVLLGTIALGVAGYLVLAVATSTVLLLLARILAGVASGNLSVAQAYVADRTRPEERARGMGLIGAAFGVGFAIGPAIGGTFAPFGLGAPALAAAGLAAANLALAAILLPESLMPEVRKTTAATGRTRFAQPIRRPGIQALLIRFFLVPFAFIAQAIRRPGIQALLITFFLVSFAFSTVPVAFPSLGIDYFGIGTTELSLIFILIGVVNIVVGTAAGRLARRAGEERLVALGTVAMMVGLAAAPFATNFISYIVLVVVVSIGVAIAFPLVPNLVSKRTPPHEQGAILGITQSFGSLARVPGPLVAGVLYVQVGPAAPFLLGAFLMAVGFAMTIKVYRESVRMAAKGAVKAATTDPPP